MRTRVKICLGLLAAVALVGLIALLAYAGEPQYKGRSLSQWLAVSRSSDTSAEQRERAAEAIRHVGKAGLPLLIKWATSDSTQKTKIQLLLNKVPASFVPGSLRKWANKPFDQTRVNEARLGFVILGADAASAIPQLARLATEVPPKPGTYWAITALGDIGPKAFPTLLAIAEDPKIPWRSAAVREIGKLGTNALPALPTIIRFLDDPDPQAAQDAATALGDLSLNPQLCIPALTRCLKHPDPLARVGAAENIVRFGPHAQSAIPDIQKAESVETVSWAKQFLQRILRGVQREPGNTISL